MVIKFYDRENELKFLNDAYNKIDAKSMFLVLYGRRRVGKTELVKKFIDGKPHLYAFLEPKSEKEILGELEEQCREFTGTRPRFESFDEFLNFIFKIDNAIVVLDEFQNLLKINPVILSKIQKYWDRHEKDSSIFLIAIGSYTGMIKRIFTDRKEPLFGRADFLINLKPFSFFQSREFLERNLEESFKIFAVFGGVPKYLIYAYLYRENSPLEIVERLFITEPAPLREEGKNILLLEFGSEHKGYFSIIEAIAGGRAVQKEIVDYTGLRKDTVGKYLHELVNVYGVIKRDYPVTERRTSSRVSRYFIKDNFYRFWFKFIYKNLSILESDPGRFTKIIHQQINALYGIVFEKVAKEFLIELNKRKRFPLRFSKIGSWWYGGEEIDLVALNEETKDVVFLECKWSMVDAGRAKKIIADLKRKATFVSWYNSRRKEHFGIIAKRIDGKEELKKQGYLAYDLRDFEKLLPGPSVDHP